MIHYTIHSFHSVTRLPPGPPLPSPVALLTQMRKLPRLRSTPPKASIVRTTSKHKRRLMQIPANQPTHPPPCPPIHKRYHQFSSYLHCTFRRVTSPSTSRRWILRPGPNTERIPQAASKPRSPAPLLLDLDLFIGFLCPRVFSKLP